MDQSSSQKTQCPLLKHVNTFWTCPSIEKWVATFLALEETIPLLLRHNFVLKAAVTWAGVESQEDSQVNMIAWLTDGKNGDIPTSIFHHGVNHNYTWHTCKCNYWVCTCLNLILRKSTRRHQQQHLKPTPFQKPATPSPLKPKTNTTIQMWIVEEQKMTRKAMKSSVSKCSLPCTHSTFVLHVVFSPYRLDMLDISMLFPG